MVYVRAVMQLSRHYRKSPDQLQREEIRGYLVYLAQQRRVAPSTYNQVRCALKFFYQVTLGREWVFDRIVCQKTEKHLPVVLSQSEVVRFFGAIRKMKLKFRALFMTIYGAGLRGSEAAALQVSDIDSQRMVIRVRQGKGKKDRYVMLSPKLLAALREYWKAFRPQTWLFYSGRDRSRPPDSGYHPQELSLPFHLRSTYHQLLRPASEQSLDRFGERHGAFGLSCDCSV